MSSNKRADRLKLSRRDEASVSPTNEEERRQLALRRKKDDKSEH